MMREEQRQTPRVRVYHPIRLHQPRSVSILETLTKNVSRGGFCCMSPVAIPISTEFSAELALSSGKEPLSLRGKVVWFQAIPHSEQFHIGMVFLDVHPENQRRLSAYLDRLAQSTLHAISS